MLRWMLLFAGLVAAFYALLWLFQERLIYFPRRYAQSPGALPAPLQPLIYSTSAGAQCAVYLPPRSAGPEASPGPLWIVFGGNAMTALDWLDWTTRHPDPSAAFLLIDYPGYGFNAGTPNRARIVESGPAAFLALAAQLDVPPERLAARTLLLGHSLGAAAALEFAVKQPPRGIVLTAPFTSLADIAAHHYGRVVLPVLTERWDNPARLAELGLDSARRPKIVILHGADDEIIPFEQGQRLAAGAPWTRFEALPGAHHNDLYDSAPETIRRAMAEVAAAR